MQLHRPSIVRAALVAAAALFPLAASAVPYSPTGTAGWWMLQSPTTYETVCQQGSACDVAPGTYTLIDFGTSPATRSTVSVSGPGGDGAAPAPSPLVRAEATCTAQDNCTAYCPRGTVALMTSCSAFGSDGTPSPVHHRPGRLESGGLAFCEADGEQRRMDVAALCGVD